jgi:hypothetical protein
MQTMNTDLRGKVRNLKGFKSEALLPLFEAVVNGIHAIEEHGNEPSGSVVIKILREDSQSTLNLEDEVPRPICGFEIEDNGIGFNDANLESFKTSDSTYKEAKGGKGLGRFLWLKAFARVNIQSTYKSNEGKLLGRRIDFDLANGIVVTGTESISRTSCGTLVKLIDFHSSYRDLPSAFKTPEKIAQRILEHCLARFISDRAPDILVVDESLGTRISLKDLFAEIKPYISTDQFQVSGESFTLHHLRLFSTRAQTHQLVYCADARGVKVQTISSLLGTNAQFDNGGQKFFYAAYITSPYLDQSVDAERQTFDIPEKPTIYSAEQPCFEGIENEAVQRIRTHLGEVVQKVEAQTREKVAQFIASDPSLRSVTKYCPEIYKELNPTSSDEKIAETLYAHKGRAELEVRRKSEKLLRTQTKSVSEVRSQYDELTRKLEDFQKDQLAGYIVLRKMIIDLLDKQLTMNSSGSYSNEEIIHDIVFPRKADSDQINYVDHNLWLVDEVLAFHRFAKSDGSLNNFSSSNSKDRPDISVFSEVSEDKRARAVSLIEFKKPQRKNFDEDPMSQLLRYVRELRNAGSMVDGLGQEIAIDGTTRFYCYAVCDLTKAVREFAENGDFATLAGEFGYYKYNSKLNTHMEIVAFNKLVVDARMRHRAFFDKLGIS